MGGNRERAGARESDREQKGRHSFLIERKSLPHRKRERQIDETHSFTATHMFLTKTHTRTNNAGMPIYVHTRLKHTLAYA